MARSEEDVLARRAAQAAGSPPAPWPGVLRARRWAAEMASMRDLMRLMDVDSLRRRDLLCQHPDRVLVRPGAFLHGEGPNGDTASR